MMPFPERAGTASSFLGICQMMFAAFVGLGIGRLLTGSALPLPLIITAIGLVALIVFHRSRKVRAAG
ncbi:MAG: hypothetical protein NT037_01655 [Hyphomicrobiales bacterium]|nr:hypothetical protein [Hyphomicrobiales bacterium]